MTRRSKSPITGEATPEKTPVALEATTCDIDGPISGTVQGIDAPISTETQPTEHQAVPVVVSAAPLDAGTSIVDVYQQERVSRAGEQPDATKARVLHWLQINGFPKQVCPGVVELRPDCFKASYGYPEAREWARARGLR